MRNYLSYLRQQALAKAKKFRLNLDKIVHFISSFWSADM